MVSKNKAIEELVDFLVDDFRPDVVLLTNLLLSGFIPELSRRSSIPVYGILQGDDIFLESLPPKDRKAAIELIGQNCKTVAGNFVTCRAYADFMSGYLAQPRETMHIVYPGINLKGHGGERTFRESPPIHRRLLCPDLR